MGKRTGTNTKCQKYLNARTRIKNKTSELAKRIETLEKARKKEKINPNTNLLPKRKPIENIVKSSRIGRMREGFPKEEFKFKRRINVT